MVSFAIKTIAGTAAAALIAQQAMCPPVAIVAFSSAALITAGRVADFGVNVAGSAISNSGGRRSVPLNTRQEHGIQAPAGVPQFEFDRCVSDAGRGGVITIDGPIQNNGVRISGLPATCMNLATVLDGNPSGGPIPVPCGSDCLIYDNLSGADYNTMVEQATRLANA